MIKNQFDVFQKELVPASIEPIRTSTCTRDWITEPPIDTVAFTATVESEVGGVTVLLTEGAVVARLADTNAAGGGEGVAETSVLTHAESAAVYITIRRDMLRSRGGFRGGGGWERLRILLPSSPLKDSFLF